MSTSARVTSFGRTFVGEVQDKEITFIAASTAYYAFVSLIPLLLLLLVTISVAVNPATANRIVTSATTSLPSSAQSLVQSAVGGQSGAGGATIASVLVLLWSALKLFRGLDTAFSRAYGRESAGIVGQVKNGIVTLVAVILGAVVAVGIGAAVSFWPVEITVAGVSAVAVVGTLATLLALGIVLLPLYYFLPGDDVTVREAIPGAAFAAVGLTVLQVVFRIYAANAGSYEAYGVLGAVLLLVTVLYFAGMVVLLGVVLNAVLAGRAAGFEASNDGGLAARLKTGGRQ
ncbi:YihY/virulence factor BrkB family protein [Halococcus sp. IIIV-5B]|uniref:YihY/virulence factor BrkB family protein n=1 Tax=Halococcus sp. IIIV-5B TaxID=2321230 RepID=UPI000E745934|nr:YihY/virulence factor BrkB family protein [Halococcus sp. IIIV-5B]RJT02699.1 YihY/virulence factor BrkB family protein [Halococcus sp. IIIV-5B]